MISKKASNILNLFPNKYEVFEKNKELGFEKQQRIWEESCKNSFNKNISYEQIKIGSVIVEKCIPKNVNENIVVIHFHGGGFALGSIITHRKFCSELAILTNITVWNIGYTLATKKKYPFQENEVKTIINHLNKLNLEVIIGGDSSGGALALSAANFMIMNRISKPKLLYLLSPWLDLTLSGKSIKELDDIDPLVHEKDLLRDANIYCHSDDLVKASPLFTKIKHNYRVHIDVGSREVLLDDSKRLYEIIKKEHDDIKLIIRDGMWHTYQLWFNGLPESKEAISELVNSINQVV